MNNINHNLPREMLALYALGILSAQEKTEVEAEIARNKIAREELKLMSSTMVALCEDVARLMPMPRKSLKKSVMNTIAIQEQHKARPSKVVVHADEGTWRESGLPGIKVKFLFFDRQRARKIYLARIEPGTTYPDHRHTGIEESLLLEGDLHVDGELLGPGDFFLGLPESVHRNAYTEMGCLIFVSSSLEDELLT